MPRHLRSRRWKRSRSSRRRLPSDGAWIGAAAGAGVGFLIGFVAGLAKVGSGWSPEPATPPACPLALAESIAPADGNTEAEGTK